MTPPVSVAIDAAPDAAPAARARHTARGDVGAGALGIEAGRPWPLGSHCRDGGVNVAVFSAQATSIDLCLFDASDANDDANDDITSRETARLRLPARSGDVFHGFVPGLRPGQIYGLRADGPWAPRDGHCFNAHKLLLDPYAREIVGRFEWVPEHRRAVPGDTDRIDRRDSATFALKARVVDAAAEAFDWGDDRPPHVEPADLVIYELHVKGFSRLNPDVATASRGTYAGLASPASIAHLQRLGITAVELLPVHQWLDEERLVALGLDNYWGYNSIGFFAPEPRLAASSPGRGVRDEFRAMVKTLHAAGIEVLLDVVYNHTAESDADGPTIAFRGLDNAGCYRLDPADPRVYDNPTGCGNAVDLRRPQMLRLVLDSLRFWATEMRVDGFRFDLATVLGRGDHGFDARSAFFTAVAQDPVLSRVKLIAEPWDLGPGGYQVGAFPRGWLEWNDRFRDDMRGIWLRGTHPRSVLAQRLCASADLFRHHGKAPSASINYVVSHDGFTLADLLTYEQKRNLANGEDNRDGTGANLGWNCGVEGPTDDPAVNAMRARLQRTLLAVTLLAQGTPMLSQGDELGHTQHGNNNPYCQDNPTTWIDWTRADADLIDFTAHALAQRRAWLPFSDRWHGGIDGTGGVEWTGGDGETLHDGAWSDPGHRALGALIARSGRGHRPLLVLLNAGDTDVDFLLPAGAWTAVLDTTDARGRGAWAGAGPAACPLPRRSLWLLVGTPVAGF